MEFIRSVGANGFSYPLRIAVDCSMQYGHAYELLQSLEKKGIVSTKRMGRIRKVTLTKKGNVIYNHLNGIYDVLGTK